VKNNYASIILKNRSFRLFLLSQGISSFGDTFQLIAVTALIFKITGSGLYAGFGLLCMPVCSLFFSMFAGSLADLIHEKYLLIINDFLRGFIAILFVFSSSIFSVYLLLFVLAFLNIFYIPPGRKFVVNLLEPEELLAGNSILIGISGAAYLIGPILAGFIIEFEGVNFAFWLNGFSFLYSGFQIAFIKINKNKNRIILIKHWTIFKNILNEIKIGIGFFLKSSQIKKLTMLSTVMCLGNTAVNFTFYSFAFNILNVTNLGWGFMISVLYGANFVALFISMILEKKVTKKLVFYIYLQFLIVSVIWLSYGFTVSLSIVILLQIFEGISSALFWIFLTTRLQLVTPASYLGRISGINEIFGNMGKIVGIAMSYLLMSYYSTQKVFIISSLLCIIYLFCRFIKEAKYGKIR
jgi:MFS transporter, DHA3 family, macrolide efflux protein